MSKVQTVSVVSFLSFCIIVGSLVFSRGFLLNRQVIHETSGPCGSGVELSSMANWCNPTPPFSKIILVLVDALRYDFVPRMRFLWDITKGDGQRSRSCLFKFVADPPTTTMQRLKALMTGTMPTFIDASANFNSYEVEEDSLIHQLWSIGKRIAFLGDDTWLSLFPKKYFKSKFVEAHPSFNAWDLDTVDKAVNKTMQEIFTRDNKSEWDVLIAHVLGVDHCGHRYGPNHPEMKRKLDEADEIVRHVFESMGEDTLLVVFGDHGMTATGDHGGDSKDETESAVIFSSKQVSKYNPPFQCSSELAISQIDLVPTLAPLLGITIPYSNIGQTISGFLQLKINSESVAANVAQVNNYIQHFPSMLSSDGSRAGDLTKQYRKIEEAFKQYQSAPNLTSQSNLQQLSEEYLKNVKSVAVSTWTQFNLPMIYTGVAITALSVVSIFLYLISVPIFAGMARKYSVLLWLWPSLSHWSVLCTFTFHFLASTALIGIVVSTLSGILVFLLLLAGMIINNYSLRKVFNNFSHIGTEELASLFSIILYTLTCLAVFSNSFVVNEGYVLGFSLIVIALLEVITAKVSSNDTTHFPENKSRYSTIQDNSIQNIVTSKVVKCSWSCFVFLLIIIRISQIFFRCREEQTSCTEDWLLHKQLSSLPEEWLVHKYFRYGTTLLLLAVFVVSFRHWMIHRSCIFSKRPRAIIARFVPSLLVVLLGVFWALQGLPYISPIASKVRILMNYLPLIYQAITLFSIATLFYKPICCIGHLDNSPIVTYTDANFVGMEINKASFNSYPSARSTSLRNGRSKTPLLSTTIQSNGAKQKHINVQVGNVVSKHLDATIYPKKNNKQSTTIVFPYDIGGTSSRYCFSEDTYSSWFLTMTSLLTLLLVQVTSTGIVPAVILETYALVCLVGIFKRQSLRSNGSWSAIVAWTLVSQYFFYATGHQPIFSAIPWDSAFVADGSSLGTGAWMSWIRAGLAVAGNLHVSQILSSLTVPLLVYWKVDKGRPESRMGKAERQAAYILYGKFLALHGLKLLMCMACSGWHRRHLMVWKIFAPKFIFEAVSFIVTVLTSLIGMVFLTRINYCHQKYLEQSKEV